MCTNQEQREIPVHVVLAETVDVKYMSTSPSASSMQENKGSSLNLRSNDSWETTRKLPVEHVDDSCLDGSLDTRDDNKPFETTLKTSEKEFFETTLKTSEKESFETPLKTSENASFETPLKTVEKESFETALDTSDLKRQLEEYAEKIRRLEAQLARFTPPNSRHPVEHDDHIASLIGQLNRQDKQIRDQEKEIEQLKSKNYLLQDQVKSTLSKETTYQTQRVKELEAQVEKAKKRIAEAEQEKRIAKDKLAEKESKLSMTQKENATLNLQLKNAVGEANRHFTNQRMILNNMAIQQEEFACAKDEYTDALNKKENELRFLKEQSFLDEVKLKRLKEVNKELHRLLQILNPNRSEDAKQCGQCQQFNVTGGPCLYHPLAPFSHNQWKYLPKFAELAENPNWENHWYYLCCDKLDKHRPRGCCMLEAHDAGLCSLHSPHISM